MAYFDNNFIIISADRQLRNIVLRKKNAEVYYLIIEKLQI